MGQGRQAYVVCPRIGGEDTGGPGAATDGPATADTDGPESFLGEDEEDAGPRRPPLAVLDLAPALAEGPLAGLRLRVLHGRLPAEEKDAAMRAFADGLADVLVATTVVEVGVDVPNATAMVVMDADRFGVSQLHQLRGRVGRGREPGLCLLVTEAAGGTRARDRLDAVAGTLDGFRLARLDLEQRREGDVLGAAQAGRKRSLRLLTLLSDEALIGQAREEATALVEAEQSHARSGDRLAARRRAGGSLKRHDAALRGSGGDADHRGAARGRRRAEGDGDPPDIKLEGPPRPAAGAGSDLFAISENSAAPPGRFVESDARVAQVIRANVAVVALPGGEVICGRVERFLRRGPGDEPAVDLVVADPPYAAPGAEVTEMLAVLAGRGWLKPGALVAVERATRSGAVAWPGGYIPDRSRRYGEATFWYGLAAAEAS